MSDLKQLKARLDQIGRDAKNTAGSLDGFRSRFSRQAGDVEQTIGGSATGVDKDMIATLQAAEKQVQQAIQALQQVSQVASRYSTSL